MVTAWSFETSSYHITTQWLIPEYDGVDVDIIFTCKEYILLFPEDVKPLREREREGGRLRWVVMHI